METLAVALAATEIAQHLRVSRWGYAAVSTGHVLGIALLVGAVVPLDLRLIGLWRSVPVVAVSRLLVPVAAVGLVLAVATGLLLLSVRAPEYAALPVVRLKLALIVLAAGSALAAHAIGGVRLD
ncbi:MAG: hypothetical protein GVY28_00795, partial [Alphaproteobacteria bacterium]|nr:hypothetical protein [Alphaproteobacteria bacterium]